METVGKQEKTKYKLAASMKECMKQMPVDKITVKNIVEGCGVARQEEADEVYKCLQKELGINE